MIYSHKNYFLYYIEGDFVNVMERYNEREDFARALLNNYNYTRNLGLLG